MSKFLKNILIFILPIFLLGMSIEIAIRNIPNDYSHKRNYLDQHASEIEVLFLGSSHAYRGINPAFIHANSFNASYVSQTLDYDYEILKKYSDHWDSLKFVVVPISYFSLFSQLEAGQEAWRAKNYTIYYGMTSSLNIADYLELLSNKLDINLDRISSYYIKRKSNMTSSKLGWGKFSSKTRKNLARTGKTAAIRHTKDNDLYLDENIEILKAMIAFANQRGIQVILYTPPAHQAYVKHLDKEQLNNTIEAMTLLGQSNQDVVYVNYLTDKEFTEQDFYNADHLNEIGAEKLTKRIDQIILELK